jgi:hypothetical protein
VPSSASSATSSELAGHPGAGHPGAGQAARSHPEPVRRAVRRARRSGALAMTGLILGLTLAGTRRLQRDQAADFPDPGVLDGVRQYIRLEPREIY